MLIFFTNLSLMEFRVRYLVLLCLFSIIDGFEWFWMGSPLKNVQLMTVFLKTPFLVLHFSYYTLMAFLNGLPDVICSIAIYADDISLYPKSDQASDL